MCCSYLQRDDCEQQLRHAICATSEATNLTLCGWPALFPLLDTLLYSLSQSQQLQTRRSQLILSVVATARAWIALAGMTLSRIYCHHRALLDCICQFASISGDGLEENMLEESCQLIQELLLIAEYPSSSPLRLEALTFICREVLY
jgi:hypothetical protein